MARTFKVTPVFTKTPPDCKTDKIKKGKFYLVRIGRAWYTGQFYKEWYGWNFDEWGTSGIQLDGIDEVYQLSIKGKP